MLTQSPTTNATEPAPRMNALQRAGYLCDTALTSIKSAVAFICRGLWNLAGSNAMRNGLLLLGIFVLAALAQMMQQMVQATKTIAATQEVYGRLLMQAAAQNAPQPPPQAIAPERLQLPGPYRLPEPASDHPAPSPSTAPAKPAGPKP